MNLVENKIQNLEAVYPLIGHVFPQDVIVLALVHLIRGETDLFVTLSTDPYFFKFHHLKWVTEKYESPSIWEIVS